jgi:hypothetical protein
VGQWKVDGEGQFVQAKEQESPQHSVASADKVNKEVLVGIRGWGFGFMLCMSNMKQEVRGGSEVTQECPVMCHV